MHNTLRPRLVASAASLMFVACLCCGVTNLHATVGRSVVLPTGKKNTAGVKLEIESRGVATPGYRPVRVTIVPLKPPANQHRQFQLVFRPEGRYGNDRPYEVSQVVELREGAAQITTTILVPQHYHVEALEIKVFEDGRRLDEFSETVVARQRIDGGSSALLVVDAAAPRRHSQAVLQGRGSVESDQATKKSELPDVRKLVWSLTDEHPKRFGDPLNAIDAVESVDLLSPVELPDRWLELSTFDIIVISQAELIALGKQRPEKLRAIAEWTRGGRVLVVYESGANFSGLAELEKALQLLPHPNAETARHRGWRARNLSARNVLITREEDYFYADEEKDSNDFDDSWNFVIRPLGFGQVVAFEGNPFPGNRIDWLWMLESTDGQIWKSEVRTGADWDGWNGHFWNFYIPGAGQTPVFSFVILISLFVLLIGPVNYYYLRRRQRLYLLLITVPVGALMVTFGLFSYAILVDRLGVKSRIRSVTRIDQRAQTGAALSRQFYYASLAPSQGLGFGDNTEIHHFTYVPYRRNTGKVQGVIWNGRQQQWERGFIESRTPCQLLTTTVDRTKARLIVGRPANNRLLVTNELQANLGWLLVMDEDGKYYAGANLAPGPGQLASITVSEAAAELKKRLGEFKLEFPPGFENTVGEGALDWILGSRYYVMATHTAANQESLLERSIERYNHLADTPLEPRTYVALADQSPLVPIGTPSQQIQSLYLIEGNY
jgi:hypothetical protein